MATTIAPTLGETASFLQGGVGASPGYSAISVRRILFAGPIQEGVIDSQSYEVSQRAAGANLSVDIAANSGNGAVVQGDSVTAQGLYFVPPHSAVINETVSAADATNPRIDRVVLEVLDDTHAGGGSNLARVRVITGTPTGGATLDNLSGIAALPSSAHQLANVLVPALDTTISNSQIRDRRKWARGAQKIVQKTATGGVTTTSALSGTASVDSTTLSRRLELSGVPIRVSLQMTAYNSSATGGTETAFSVDDTIPDSATVGFTRAYLLPVDARAGVGWVYETTPSAGSHVIRPVWGRIVTGTSTMQAGSGARVTFAVTEIVGQDYANNTVTSG